MQRIWLSLVAVSFAVIGVLWCLIWAERIGRVQLVVILAGMAISTRWYRRAASGPSADRAARSVALVSNARRSDRHPPA